MRETQDQGSAARPKRLGWLAGREARSGTNDLVIHNADDAAVLEFIPLRRVSPLRPDSDSDDEHVIARRSWLRFDGVLGFLLLVVIPTLAAGLYFGLIASDRYVSTVQFVVRSPATDAGGGLPAAGSVVSESPASALSDPAKNDAYAVEQYIESPAGMAAANATVDLRKIFGRDGVDALSRYPWPFMRDNGHWLYTYYSRMIDVSNDTTTGIITLSAQAFTAEDAKSLAQSLLDSAETLVNRMNVRSQQDALVAARTEVQAATREVADAQKKLTDFRLRATMIDPEKMTDVAFTTISELMSKTLDLKSQLSDARKNTPNSNQIGLLQTQINSMEDQIAAEQAKLSGPNASMTPLLADYERLVLGRELAERLASSAYDQLQAAKLDLNRQNVYIEPISGPTLADYSEEPLRAILTAVVAAASLFAFLILRTFLRDSRAHQG